MNDNIKKLCDKHYEIITSNVLAPRITGELMSHRDLPTIYDICQIVKPKNILELGFNRGSSALMWLMCSDANLLSTDMHYLPQSVDYLKSKYKDRFNFRHINHEVIRDCDEYIEQFDLIFVDGGHQRSSIERDIKTCLKFNPKYVAFDDFYHPSHHKNHIDLVKGKYIHNFNIIKKYDRRQDRSNLGPGDDGFRGGQILTELKSTQSPTTEIPTLGLQ